MSDTIAGRYTLIDPIARGGSGTVWRAWDQRHGKLCAAKVLRQRDSADLLRFVREQSVKLEHPHVLAPYGWAAEDEHVVIAMDLCDGGTLESVLQDHGALSDEVVEEVMLQLLRALQFVHAEGWIHRDVKPANLMMNATGTGRPLARLADFGIATQCEDARLTRLGTVVGTPGYIAPELLEGADPAAAQDLFAAGVVAMRMVCPHEGRGETPQPESALQKFGAGSLLGAEIAALLDPEPAVRHDGAMALLERLAPASEGRSFQPARTRHGEPLEIFQTLDPLPEEWSRIVEGDGAAARQPLTGAVTAPRSGDVSDPVPTSTGGAPLAASAPQAEPLDSGLIRTNYGMVSTPPPGGEPLIGPAAGPAGASLHGMPSGLTGDGAVAPASPGPVGGAGRGAMVQGPLPRGQQSRATLLEGAVSSGWNAQARPGVSHLTVDESTGETTGGDGLTAPGTGSVAGGSVPSAPARNGPLERLGIHGTATGWMLIAVVLLVLVLAVLLIVLALTDDGGTAPVPPAETASSSPATNNGTPGGAGNNFQNSDPTIGSLDGNGPGRIGD
ncbi:serine/threonine protein kinase [Kocuria coralli]|uniref:Serine/threonine protein kinase n=1 Tax=Kocuria coralli TaxID=1461025 RepID=A0A5J5KUM3_9MICC|nr:serine/threonine-protein kinase [Kocuria coralli]KAA9393417.1 serine/threonine protein kinase [Kocuria coralli]